MRLAYEAATTGAKVAPGFEAFLRLQGYSLTEIAARLKLSPAFPVRYAEERDARTHLISLQPGAEMMLTALRQRDLPLAVVTGKAGEAARNLLARLNHKETFLLIMGSDEVLQSKPSPVHAHAAIANLATLLSHSLVPSQVLLVGDSDADMRCGRAAGCMVGFARWGYADLTDVVTRPDLIFHAPGDITKMVGAIKGAE